MQQWEYLLLAVSVNAWQKPAPDISVIDGSGQMTHHTFQAFHTYVKAWENRDGNWRTMKSTAGSSSASSKSLLDTSS